MPLPSHVFREYDIRGVADRDLADSLAESIARAFATEIGRAAPSPRVALARDCRLSSPRLHAAATRGLVAAGARVIDVGIGPSPKLYFSAHHLATDESRGAGDQNRGRRHVNR